MGGGKSRAICEAVFELSVKHAGLKTLVCRQAHTSIIETTKKTMMEEVIPPEFQDPRFGAKKKESGGEDYIVLPNGSMIHFIGLEDPIRWFSSQIGLLVFDEAHEISEDTVVKLATRLRQACRDCAQNPIGPDGLPVECDHLPHKIIIAFNPENPGHWLHRWFITGAIQNPDGFYKPDLYFTGASESFGDAEFIFARADDNPYLSTRYKQVVLASLPEHLRRRYMEGEWLFVSGTCFFSVDALTAYQAETTPPKFVGETKGDVTIRKNRPGFNADRSGKSGRWAVWATPVRERWDETLGRQLPAHRYVVAVDVSSGGATDYSGIQVIDVDAFAQVARFQGMLAPDLVAVEAYRIGRIYNDALVAPEVTGGWGFTIVNELRRLKYPRIYTRRIEDRLARTYTDKLGWDTTSKSRAVMLDTLERVLREREFILPDVVTLNELATFVRDETGRPAAQPGTNDDMVSSLAIGVVLADQMPRQLVRVKRPDHQPRFAATGI